MVSRYYVDPSLDATQGLSGLSEVIGQVQEKKRAKEEQMRQQARMEAAQEEIAAAMETGDPMEIARVSLRYPEFQETISQTMGTVDEARSNEQRQFMSSILAQPGNAKEMYERRIDRLESQGRDATHTRQSYQDYLKNPDQELREIEQLYAMQFPDQYQSFKKATAPADVGAVSGVKTFMDQEGNVVGTFDLSDPEDRAYVIQNNLTEAPERRIQGTREEVMGKTEGRNLRDLETDTKNLVGTVGDAIEFLRNNPDANTWTGKAASVVNDIQQEATALARNTGFYEDDIQEGDLLNPDKYADRFDKLGIANRELRSMLTSLAYQDARRFEGGRLSESDIRLAFDRIGANSSDPRAIARVLRNVAERAERNFQNSWTTRKGREDAPPPPSVGTEELPSFEESRGPEVGTVDAADDGTQYRFKGGDPNNPDNWEAVE